MRTADAIRQAVEYSRKQAAAGKGPCTDGVQGALPAGAGEPLRGEGVEVCTRKRGYRLPSVGEDVIVGGILDPDNPGHLIADQHQVFFVSDGTVSRGVTEPANWQPMTLDQLDQDLNPGRPR